jgi:SAM-dependent methyltransferase
MMFGTRERFDYVHCASCGCLQIAELPSDPSLHYAEGYYSLRARERRPRRGIRRRLQRRAARALLRGTGGPARWLARLLPQPESVGWMLTARVPADAPVLDVGCGRGERLRELADFGFLDLTGIDPHVERDVTYPDGVRVLRRDLGEESRRYRLIVLSHVLEHALDPRSMLVDARSALEPGGCVLVRIPLADGAAFREYGVDWVQLDAPRHLHLFTRRALERLAGGAGLRIEAVHFDSSAFQFWGSELYRRGIPLASRSAGGRSPRHHFSRRELREFRRRAEQLNREGRGDSACFYLRVAEATRLEMTPRSDCRSPVPGPV